MKRDEGARERERQLKERGMRLAPQPLPKVGKRRHIFRGLGPSQQYRSYLRRRRTSCGQLSLTTDNQQKYSVNSDYFRRRVRFLFLPTMYGFHAPFFPKMSKYVVTESEVELTKYDS